MMTRSDNDKDDDRKSPALTTDRGGVSYDGRWCCQSNEDHYDNAMEDGED